MLVKSLVTSIRLGAAVSGARMNPLKQVRQRCPKRRALHTLGDFDHVGTRGVMSKTIDITTRANGGEMTPAFVALPTERFGPTGFLRRWKQNMHRWTRARWKGLGSRSVRFEEIVHEFARTIESADDAGVVKAALVRQARRHRASVSNRVDIGTGTVTRTTTSRTWPACSDLRQHETIGLL